MSHRMGTRFICSMSPVLIPGKPARQLLGTCRGQLGREHLSPGTCPQGHRLPFDPHLSQPALPKQSSGSPRDQRRAQQEQAFAGPPIPAWGKSSCREAEWGEEALAIRDPSEGFGHFPQSGRDGSWSKGAGCQGREKSSSHDGPELKEKSEWEGRRRLREPE